MTLSVMHNRVCHYSPSLLQCLLLMSATQTSTQGALSMVTVDTMTHTTSLVKKSMQCGTLCHAPHLSLCMYCSVLQGCFLWSDTMCSRKTSDCYWVSNNRNHFCRRRAIYMPVCYYMYVFSSKGALTFKV